MIFQFLEKNITPEQFAEILCDDLDLPSSTFIPPIAQSIRQQIDAFPSETFMEDAPADQRVVLKVCFCFLKVKILIIGFFSAQYSCW